MHRGMKLLLVRIAQHDVTARLGLHAWLQNASNVRHAMNHYQAEV